MLPQQSLSSQLAKSPFLYPDNVVRATELEDYEMGGIALQDPTAGLLYQGWYGSIDPVSKIASLKPIDSILPPTPIFTETVTPVEFTFSFDLNMRYLSAVRFADNSVRFRWYDTSVPGYVITTYTGIQSMMLGLDDKRPVTSVAADVILTYLKTADNKLYFRAQRDRYLIEYPLSDAMAGNLRITNFGMGKNNRVQWRFAIRKVT